MLQYIHLFDSSGIIHLQVIPIDFSGSITPEKVLAELNKSCCNMADNSYLAIVSEDEQFQAPVYKGPDTLELSKETNRWSGVRQKDL